MYRLKLFALTLLVGLAGLGGFGLLLNPSTAFASASQGDACTGLSQLDQSKACGSSSQSTVNKIISTVVKIISVVLGAVAIIMVVVAGFKYITSGGDSGAVGSAKQTLIYALVGIAVAVLAQFLVHFVINASVKASGG